MRNKATRISVGDRFGKLVVIGGPESRKATPISKRARIHFKCLCDCGSEKLIVDDNLRTGNSTNCGCFHQRKRESRLVALVGKEIGWLTVVGLASPVGKHSRVSCVCRCGKAVDVRDDAILAGTTVSCGCFNSQKSQAFLRSLLTTHGKSKDRVYKIFHGMMKRCYNARCKSYCRYGGRGICVCCGMRTFDGFYDVMGDPPDGLSIDRKNNDTHYSCGRCEECVRKGWEMNCRWATTEEQANNKSWNVSVEIDGEALTATQAAKRIGMKPSTLLNRLWSGWSVHDALHAPVRKRGLRKNGFSADGESRWNGCLARKDLGRLWMPAPAWWSVHQEVAP